MSDRFGILVVLLVFVAGCSGFSPATDSGPSDADETLTPVPVGTPTSAQTVTGQLPPGISQNGSIATNVLLAAHRNAVSDRSFAWHARYNLTDLSQEKPVTGYHRRVNVSASGTYLVETNRWEEYTSTVFVDGTGSYAKNSFENTTNFRHLEYAVGRGHYIATEQYVRTFFSVETAEISAVDSAAESIYRIHVTETPTAVSERHPEATLSNYVATAYVTPDGLVRSLFVQYEYAVDGQRHRFTLRVDYSGIGNTTVDPPAWIERLRSGTESATNQTKTDTK